MGEVTPSWSYSEPGVFHLPFKDRLVVSSAVVRDWARREGLPVRERGHLPDAVIAAFNKANRFVRAEYRNPRSGNRDAHQDAADSSATGPDQSTGGPPVGG